MKCTCYWHSWLWNWVWGKREFVTDPDCPEHGGKP